MLGGVSQDRRSGGEAASQLADRSGRADIEFGQLLPRLGLAGVLLRQRHDRAVRNLDVDEVDLRIVRLGEGGRVCQRRVRVRREIGGDEYALHRCLLVCRDRWLATLRGAFRASDRP